MIDHWGYSRPDPPESATERLKRALAEVIKDLELTPEPGRLGNISLPHAGGVVNIPIDMEALK